MTSLLTSAVPFAILFVSFSILISRYVEIQLLSEFSRLVLALVAAPNAVTLVST